MSDREDAPAPDSGGKRTVLVVEDEEDLASLLELNLQLAGYEVRVAQDGSAAIDEVVRARPDLILLDVMMPFLNGWQVLRALKENEDTREIPVIMVTARTEEQDIIRGHLQGAVRYITKPFDLKALLATVAVALEPPDEYERTRRLDRVKELLGRLAEIDAGRSGDSARIHITQLEHPPPVTSRSRATSDDEVRLRALTGRQRWLAGAIAAGRPAREIAQQLGVSRTNIYAMRTRIARKLGVTPDEVGDESRRLGLTYSEADAPPEG